MTVQRWMSSEVIFFHSAHEGTHGRMAKVACVRHSTMPDSLLHNLELAYFNTELRKHCSKERYLGALSSFKQTKLGARRSHFVRKSFLPSVVSLLYPKHRDRLSLQFLYLSEDISSERRTGISHRSRRTLGERPEVTEGQRLKTGGLHRHNSHLFWESIQ